MSTKPGPALLGIRHVAVPAKNRDRAVEFYCRHLGFAPYDLQNKDWGMIALGETSLSFFQLPPDQWDSVGKAAEAPYRHFGILCATREDVDSWHRLLTTGPDCAAKSVKIETPKLHRDGSYGFYLRDTEDNFLELIWIPETSTRNSAGAPTPFTGA